MCARTIYPRYFLYANSSHTLRLKNALNETLDVLSEHDEKTEKLIRLLPYIFAIGFTQEQWKKVCVNVKDHVKWSYTDLYLEWKCIIDYAQVGEK
jgi:hypothetical protein